jgi:hypothetical protein
MESVDYAEKYMGVDLKRIDATTLQDVDECSWVLDKLRAIIGHIEDQLGRAELDPEGTDPRWVIHAKRALFGTRQTFKAVHDRRGRLYGQIKRDRQNQVQRAFMDAAMELLPKDTITRIWDLAHLRRPGAFQQQRS